ncbi:Piwi-domain-containing protein [Xylaria sp. CBS 124048]|nr:Piwi-domain-containing protein [Xylaria sp. CBS 124048]
MKLEDDLIKKHASVKSSGTGKEAWFPCRPAFGTQGTKVTLWTNYFKLDTSTKVALLKYSVKAKYKEKAEKSKGEKGKGEKGKGNRKVMEPKGLKLHKIIRTALAQVAGSVPFATEFKDQVITLEPLSLPEDSVVLVPYADEGKDDIYEVKFHGPVTIDLPGLLKYLNTMQDPSGPTSFPKFEDAIDAISIITGYAARSNTDVASLGRSRYFPLTIEDEQYELGQLEFNRIIRGYFQSARPATGRLVLNANVAHGVFRLKGDVCEVIKKFQKNEDLNKALSKLRAQCKILSDDKNPEKTRIIQKMICGLATPADGTGQNRPKVRAFGATANEVQFYLQEPAPAGLKGNAYITVAEYYKKRYGYTVRPENPVLNVGSKAKPVYMPAEFVRILDGQAMKRKTNSDETRGMIEFACRSPFANATSIAKYGRQVLGLDTSENLRRFGLQVGKTLLTVQGRELVPPTILYKDMRQPNTNKTVTVYEGEWNMESVRVIKPGRRIDRWFYISIEYAGHRAHQRHKEVLIAMEAWIKFLQTQGIAIADRPLSNPNTQVTIQRSVAEAVRPVFEGLKASKPQFVFVVLPGRKTDSTIYNEVKKLGDRDYGYLSQNILQNNLLKQSAQIYANLGLKINLKMGGINHKLKDDVTIIKQEPTMVVGYDVTHPTNLAGNTSGLPSLVGMVASIDNELGQWPATAWAQTGRVEMLDETLEKRFAERLQLYSKNNKRLPANIIIFRDGVSEGQFSQVLDQELPHIRNACKAIYPANQSPKIALIVSVKRHQTRFYPTDPNHMIKSSRNVKNGTVVDRGVTQAITWDFFLTAHKGLQGTSRPAHYTVLLDEVFRSMSRDQAANQLEKLTFEMCHLFGRATKAVSICPPAYYADILCTRARVYLSDLFENSDTKSSVSGTTTTDVFSIDVHESLKDTMFYI